MRDWPYFVLTAALMAGCATSAWPGGRVAPGAVADAGAVRVASHVAAAEAYAGALVERFDADRDGRLAARELAGVTMISAADVRAADLDGDGALTAAELRTKL